MNHLESAQIIGPYEENETCAKLSIDTVNDGFVFRDISVTGEMYTFSCWVMSDSPGQISMHGKTENTESLWKKYTHTFLAEDEDVVLRFLITGTYYICYAKLERGNQSTDFTSAPEDQNAELGRLNEKIEESVSALSVSHGEIRASVSKTQETLSGSIGALGTRLEKISNDVSAKMDAKSVALKIQEALSDGVSSVATSTGFRFDSKGLLVEKSGTDMKTQITENGMTVHQNHQEVLTANSQGVNARNLHATTYLMVGGRSRFENYGFSRTGCFWIGG